MQSQLQFTEDDVTIDVHHFNNLCKSWCAVHIVTKEGARSSLLMNDDQLLDLVEKIVNELRPAPDGRPCSWCDDPATHKVTFTDDDTVTTTDYMACNNHSSLSSLANEIDHAPYSIMIASL